MRVLACGGRTFDQWRTVATALDALGEVTVLMQGGAGGADALAVKWADTRNVPVITFPANWRRGRAGGPLRNAFMIAEGRPDVVVAFPGGPGTADMVRRASEAGIPILRRPE